MAWYSRAIERFPSGLISQAQAAAMLGVTRMTINRLLARGHLRAVYFPRPPNIAGLAVGVDDPTWRRIAEWLGVRADDPRADEMPKACYVSFADVVRLWRQLDVQDKCTRDWQEILGLGGPAEVREQVKDVEGEATEEMDSWML